jgi:O-antigen/teichoic acid export membrane protein
MLKKRLSNLLWIFLEKFGLILLSFITFIVFAQYLTVQEYGTAIFALAIVELVGMFFCALWNDTLVRQEFETSQAYSSVFWLGGAVVIFTMTILSLVVAWLSNDILLIQLVLISSTKVIALVLARPFVAQMRLKNNFKRLALRTLYAKLFGATVAIAMAISGKGAYAVIMQLVLMEIVSLIAIMPGNVSSIMVRPSLVNLLSLTKEGMPIAIKQLMSNCLIKCIIIILGLTTSKTMVGYFAFANRLIELPYSAFTTGLRSYALPVMAKRAKIKGQLERFISHVSIATSVLVTPIIICAAILSPPFISFVFSSKWDGSIYLFQLIAFFTCFKVLVLYQAMALVAVGKARIGLYAEFFNLTMTLIMVYILSNIWGITGAVFALGFSVLSDVVIKFWSISRELKSDNFSYAKACCKILFSGAVMLLVMFFTLNFIGENIYFLLVLSIFFGFLSYFSSLFLLKIKIKTVISNAISS